VPAPAAAAVSLSRRARRHVDGGRENPQENRRQQKSRRMLQVDETFRHLRQSLVESPQMLFFKPVFCVI